MKRFIKTTHGILILIIASFLVIAAAANKFTSVTTDQLGSAAFFAQSTVTPEVEVEAASEIGSTDGIVMMGVIIVMIVVVPILLRRKSWSSH